MEDLWGVAARIVSWSGSLWFWFYSQGVLGRADWRALWFRKHPTSPLSKWMWQVVMKRKKTKRSQQRHNNEITDIKTPDCPGVLKLSFSLSLSLHYTYMPAFIAQATRRTTWEWKYAVDSYKTWPIHKTKYWKNVYFLRVSQTLLFFKEAERNLGVNYWRFSH